MKTPTLHQSATDAVLVLAAIKAAVEAFDRGEQNVFATLETIVTAVTDRAAVVPVPRRQSRSRRRAA